MVYIIRGVKYLNKDVGYVSFTKHFCPDCSSKLKTVKVSKIINFNSPEADKYDFYFGLGQDGFVVNGDVKFVWKEFECSNCKRHFTVEELKKIEGISIDECNTNNQNKSNQVKDLIIFCMLAIIVSVIVWLIKRFI